MAEERRMGMTALISAYGRAYHSLYEEPRIFDDFLARHLISDTEFEQISGHIADGIRFFDPGHTVISEDRKEALRWAIQGQIAPVPLSRAAYCEDMLRNAIMLGAGQYVILGAGYDTFAFRNEMPHDRLEVFEVDHPDVQAKKMVKIRKAGWTVPNNLHFVPFDLTKPGFADDLIKAGFNRHRLSFFSLLGVSYYLEPAQLHSLLCQISMIVPDGSGIVFDIGDENFFDMDNPSGRVKRTVAMAAGANEPMKACYGYRQIESLLEDAGFLIYEYLKPDDIGEMYFEGREDRYRPFENTDFVLAAVHH